ncbi:MAG: transporter ATP-binding protein [Alphaproteobacteria bacterium]|jgi:ATP-binding cassette subfamily B protein|nr:transporter ATP-binding protein [Alphaproteobacteria bacterium]
MFANAPSTLTAYKRVPRTPDTPFAFIRYVLKHCSVAMKWRAVAAVMFEISATICDTLVTWVLGRIVGVTSNGGPDLWKNVAFELGLLAALWTVRNASYRGREWMERIYVPELLNTTRTLLFARLIQQSQAFLHANFAGVLANHVRRAGDVISSLRDKVQYNIMSLLVRFITGGFLLWNITPLFALFVPAFIIVGIICAVITAPKWTSLSANHAEKSSRLTGYIVDSTTNLSIVQQNVGWREELSRLDVAQEEMTETFRARYRYVSIFWGTFDLIMTFFLCGFMALVVYGWQQGQVNTGQLAMTVGLAMNMFGALAGTVSLLSQKFDDVGILQESLQKISTPLSVIDKPQAPDLEIAKGEIEFRNVDFSYVPGQPVFTGLSLKIQAGQKVGFVGVSGAGKTTICQILLRAYDVQGGGIYIDGQNIADVTQDSLHAAISVIPQEPVLFHRTLGENIRYGRPDAQPADVEAAAKAAEAEGFISTLPKGFDTLVGERGVKLSGGQRQRIAIARAIIKDAPILVLDEATSALDSETEKAIQLAMTEAMKGRTTVVIAHRLSTLSHMDRIVVMEKGRVMEDGSFKELLDKNGTFARMWNMQAGGFLPDQMPLAV